MNTRIIMMKCGYAEETCVSTLIFCDVSGKGFSTPKGAVTELALDMYAKYKKELYPENKLTKKCCKKAKKSLAGNYCSICGKYLVEESFNEVEFMGMIDNLHNTDYDSYGLAEYANGRYFKWSPFDFSFDDPCDIFANSGKDVLQIEHSAEGVLLLALSEANSTTVTCADVSSAARLEWERIKSLSK
jgi:hypothetical protein